MKLFNFDMGAQRVFKLYIYVHLIMRKRQARLAKPTERDTLNLVVVGSSPTVGAF